MKILLLGEARAKGAPRYFTGIRCCRGHIAERITVNATCYICWLENKRQQRRGCGAEYWRVATPVPGQRRGVTLPAMRFLRKSEPADRP
jgi:hypothetical protein